jgi:transposase-like protein
MDIESRLEKLKAKIEQDRSRNDFHGHGYSQSCRRAVLKIAAEIGVKKVTKAIGISNPTVYSWRSQYEGEAEAEGDMEPQLDVTRVSLHAQAQDTDPQVVARFWIGENAIEILSADVVFELARRSLGGMA